MCFDPIHICTQSNTLQKNNIAYSSTDLLVFAKNSKRESAKDEPLPIYILRLAILIIFVILFFNKVLLNRLSN